MFRGRERTAGRAGGRVGIGVDGRPGVGVARTRRLDVAVAASVVLVFAALPALVYLPIDEPLLLRSLAAVAALCVSGLALRRAPSVAWLAAISASGLAATLWFDRARPLLSAEPNAPWILVASIASVWAIATAVLAAAYATRPPTRLDPLATPVAVALVGWLVVGCLTTVGVVLAGQKEPDPAFTWVDVATVPIGVFLPLVLVLIALGAVADVRAAAVRARMGLGAAGGAGRGPQQTTAWDLAVATARELVPGQAAIQAAAHDAERTRLAGDLHAAVLPTLRRAIDEAERGGDPDALARQLRVVDLELERLMADRWPVVLEAFGLVRALEDLAERLEASGSPPISIDVAGITGQADDDEAGVARASAGRPPTVVERAAWRVAEIALDNAVRHAHAAAIEVSIAAVARSVQLVVRDNGVGIPVGGEAGDGPRQSERDRSSTRRVGRGLADARRRAGEVGATVAVGRANGGGTAVTFEWRSPGSD